MKGTVSHSLIDVAIASASKSATDPPPHCTQPLTPSPQFPDALLTSPLLVCWCGSMLAYANFGSMQIAYGMQINALNN